jgi:hypothetical protein
MKIVRRWLAYRRIVGELSGLPSSNLSELGTSQKAVRDFAWHCARVEAERAASRVLKLPAFRSSRAAPKKQDRRVDAASVAVLVMTLFKMGGTIRSILPRGPPCTYRSPHSSARCGKAS